MLYINNTTSEAKCCRFYIICRMFLHMHTCILTISLQLHTVNSWKYLTTFWIYTYIAGNHEIFFSSKFCTQSSYFSFCKVWSLCHSSNCRLSLTSSLTMYSKILFWWVVHIFGVKIWQYICIPCVLTVWGMELHYHCSAVNINHKMVKYHNSQNLHMYLMIARWFSTCHCVWVVFKAVCKFLPRLHSKNSVAYVHV